MEPAFFKSIQILAEKRLGNKKRLGNIIYFFAHICLYFIISIAIVPTNIASQAIGFSIALPVNTVVMQNDIINDITMNTNHAVIFLLLLFFTNMI